MRIYPAIDIRNGKAVRLKMGNYDDMTVYGDDPVKIALDFKALGAQYIHVVDLDAARVGESENSKVIGRIAIETGLPVQTGGGIRSLENIETKLNAGVARVIIGTRAVQEPEFVGKAIERFGADKIVVGLDAKNGMAAVHGWEVESDKTVIDLAEQFRDMGVQTIVYTDISRDGMLSGPDVMTTEKLVDITGLDIIASGGVGSSFDLERLEEIGVEGVIIGKAYYEGKVDLKKEIPKYM